MSPGRRLAFSRARMPVAVAMRVVAEALAAPADLAAARDAAGGPRRSVFAGPRLARRGAPRVRLAPAPARPARGCEDLH